MTSPPDISVVVPVRNGAGSLPALLRSLAAQAVERDRYEVIVVDNASSDGTAETARSHGARVLFDPVPNRSGARNTGTHAARADVVAFTDADCTVSPGWLRNLLACRGRAPLIAGPVEISARARPNAIERFESMWRFSQGQWVTEGWAATANLMVERSAFDAVGGFDTAYRHIGEDADFCIRAGRAGFRIAYCEDALAYHRAEYQPAPFFRRALLHGYSAAQAARRVGSGHTAWREPLPALSPRRALGHVGVDSGELPPSERIRLGALASATYATRIAGSIWAEVARAR